jgi:AdoMet-dependent heme synthase
MSLEQVSELLEQAVQLAVKEFYFTGGEPFLHPDIIEVLHRTLATGPVTVLTNATRFTAALVTALAQERDASIYSLELRVSLDGFTPVANDAIRGSGTFGRAVEGIKLLLNAGFLPIITAMRSWEISDDEIYVAGFKQMLSELGCRQPRIKLLPSLKIGQEALRDREYLPTEYVTESMLSGFDLSQLLCRSSRIATANGVHACPILVDQPDAWLGPTLESAVRPVALRHQACFSCYQFGALCSNASSVTDQLERMRSSEVWPDT